MKQILIIDDEDGIRQILSVYAEMLGLEPTLLDGPAACDLHHDPEGVCNKDLPCTDFLLIDQNLARMNGLDFIRRQSERGCRLPARCKAVMAQTLDGERFRQAKKIGCHVLQKPVTFEIFESWIASQAAQPGQAGDQPKGAGSS